MKKFRKLAIGIVTLTALVIVVALAALLTTSCSQRASVVSPGTAKDIVGSLTYAQDARTHVCYAVVASRHMTEVDQNGFTITYVPCTHEVLAQIGPGALAPRPED